MPTGCADSQMREPGVESKKKWSSEAAGRPAYNSVEHFV